MPADIVLTCSSIITMDEAAPRAQAVAIDTTTGTIIDVGTLAGCKAAADPGAEVHDLGSAVLMPGFIDPHSHPFIGGVATQPPVHWIAPYVGYPTYTDVTALFTELDAEEPDGKVLIFNGLDRLLHQCDELTAPDLDQFFPARPVLVLDNSGHEAYFNTAVIQRNGWDKNPPGDPAGASFGRNADGSLNGRAYEMGALISVATPLMTEAIPHQLYSAAQMFVEMSKAGITATSDMAYSPEYLPGYEAIFSTRNCPLRISMYHISTDAECGQPLQTAVPESMLRKQGVKLWADGSPWVGNVANSFPYLDTPVVRKAGIPLGPAGESAMNYSRAQLDAILDQHAPEGWQMAFHVNGDTGADIVLDAYERALSKHGLLGTDHRWRLEHCGAVRRDQFERAASLGVVVSLGQFQFIYWGDLLDGTVFESEIGGQWIRAADAVAAGVHPSFHNDGSVSPPIPLLNVQSAITRKTPSGQVHGAEQIVSLDDAFKAITVNAAYALHRNHEIGSIEQGKFADFVQLSTDPYTVDPDRLATDVTISATWINGKLIDNVAFLHAVNQLDPTPEHAAVHRLGKCC